jgi:hypothetical protein
MLLMDSSAAALRAPCGRLGRLRLDSRWTSSLRLPCGSLSRLDHRLTTDPPTLPLRPDHRAHARFPHVFGFDAASAGGSFG